MKKIILVLAGISVALFFAEYMLRSIYPDMDLILDYIGTHADVMRISKEYTASYRFSEALGYEAIPGQNKHINTFGMFDRECLPVKESSTIRMLVLGDSVTMSYPDVYPEHARYTEYAEDIINNSIKPYGSKIEILNAGFSGYGIMEYEAYLRLKAVQIRPDIVLLALTHGDLEKRPFHFLELEDGDIFVYRAPLEGIDLLQMPFYRRSVLFRMSTFFILKKAYAGSSRYGGMDNDDSFEYIAQYCRKRNIKAAAVIFPLLKKNAEYTQVEKKVYENMIEAIKKSGLRYINAGDYLDWEKVEEMKKNRDDFIHFSHYGHRVVGEIVAEFMLKEGILSDGRSSQGLQ